MKRAIVLLACLALALLCYGVGFHFGAVLVIGAGMFFEGLFWIKLVMNDRRDRDATQQR